MLPMTETETYLVPNVRTEILADANEILNGDREAEYGKPEDNFKRIAELWSVVLETEVEPYQVALCMALLKAARLVNTPMHKDSYVDMAGYVALAGELAGIDD